MKAMILAAGLGTRLRPLTDTIPKALVEISGIPLLEIVITCLQRYGFNEIIINVFHFAGRIIEFLHQKSNLGIDIQISHEKDGLLDTGGGLKKAAWFFDDQKPFLVHNVDILSNIDLRQLYAAHLHTHALATLAVRKRQSVRYLLFDQHNILCGWENRQTQERKITRVGHSPLTALGFSGIQVICPAIFDLLTEQGVFSIIDVYLRLAATQTIVAFQHDDSVWIDVGQKEHLKEASEILRQIY